MQDENPYAAPQPEPQKLIVVDWVLASGKVNVGKDKGQGWLLLTPNSIFAFRSKNSATMVGTITGVLVGCILGISCGLEMVSLTYSYSVGGLLGDFIGSYVDKRRAARQTSLNFTVDPEILELDAKLQKLLSTKVLLAKMPLNQTIEITRQRKGYRFDDDHGSSVEFQGASQKKFVHNFLALHGLDEDSFRD